MQNLLAPIANMTQDTALHYVREIAKAARQRGYVAMATSDVKMYADRLSALLVRLDEPTLAWDEREKLESKADDATRLYVMALQELAHVKRLMSETESHISAIRNNTTK